MLSKLNHTVHHHNARIHTVVSSNLFTNKSYNIRIQSVAKHKSESFYCLTYCSSPNIQISKYEKFSDSNKLINKIILKTRASCLISTLHVCS